MTSPRHRTAQRSYKRSLVYLFSTMILFYILYSNILLSDDDRNKKYTNLSTKLDSSSNHSFTTNSSSSSSNVPEETKPELAKTIELTRHYHGYNTELKHIVFGIAASSNLWETRKEYIKAWWRPNQTRGVVWVDKKVRTYKTKKCPRLGSLKTLQGSSTQTTWCLSSTRREGAFQYDHTQFYYIGSGSECHIQNILFSYAMAYGGGGFAISYPLAKELSKMQDKCIQRYPGLYGSDDRIQACMAELGVPLTRELGFHQYDVYGDLLGLLGAHPVTPFVSLHHLDVVEPVFPRMKRVKAVEHLLEAANVDSASLMQQSICYDSNRFWSISVSWGYVVQIMWGVMSPRELEMPSRTFLNWYKGADYTAYAFNTRPVERHPCLKPFLFYMRKVTFDRPSRQTIGVYFRHKIKSRQCRWRMASPEKFDYVIVIKKQDDQRWRKSPRRDCCRVLQSETNNSMIISVGNCREGEISELKLI
ncbi:hypothetical protein F3Y22_tig00112131pilonHSYRG00040 [Hibiscus syriacus]|uniref:Uncharacterized protein n=1 Tax=Hibiscus syriacus TaxID=106335 RepID=A0A6A2X5W2_HIBSY|nr:hypothetical protein F3Y22_tig00112131pilonHSYRG00040 [Hibiscus syriacus]